MRKEENQMVNDSLLRTIQTGDLIKILEIVLENPLAHINRIDFLSKIYGVNESDIRNGNISVSLKKKELFAKQSIRKNITRSTSLSFFSGLPGGLAMVGTIPADILQNMVFSIRLIQELAYIYDYEDIIDQDGEIKIDGLILFLGVMFGAQGAASLIRVASTNAARYASKKIMTAALTKTIWYPLLKNISKVVASKTLTKKTLASAVSKAVPFIGAVTSGSITAVTMELASNKLNRELVKGYHSNYSEESFNKDIQIIEAEFEEIKQS